MALAYYTGNYYLWVIVELSFGIIYSFILNWKINQVYPWLKSEVSQGRILFKKYPEVMKYTKQLFVHKISAFVQFQISPFLIYLFVSLQTVAFYGNYTLIIDKMNQLLNNLFGSVSAGIGNLIAEGNSQKVIQIFWELMAMRFFIVGIAIFGFYQLMSPFILLWLGEEYVLPKSILILLIINFFISLSKGTDSFLYGYGLFNDTWAPVSESIIYIIVALIGGYYCGLIGVIWGSTISLFIIVGMWKPYFLFVKGFKQNVCLYWVEWIKYVAILVVSITLCTEVIQKDVSIRTTSWFDFIQDSLLIMFLFSTTYAIFMYVLSKSFRHILKRLLFKQNF